jgi:hypothetical protein
MGDIAQLLTAPEQGHPHAAGRLLPLVYRELRKLAAQRWAQERLGRTLRPACTWPSGPPFGVDWARSAWVR